MRFPSRILPGFLAIAVLVGCGDGEPGPIVLGHRPDADADGSEEPDDASAGGKPSDAGDAGGAGGSGPSDASTGDASLDGSAGSVDAGKGGSGGGGSAGKGGSAGAGGSAGTGGTGGSATIPCTSSTTCSGATDMGEISGEQGSDAVQAQGSTEAWVKVRVRETDESLWGGVKLKVKFTLTSPTGTNFNMCVYHNADNDVVECTDASDFSLQPAGTPDVVALEWGEGAVPNGADDDRWVMVNVKLGQGDCKSTAKWKLVAEGNKN